MYEERYTPGTLELRDDDGRKWITGYAAVFNKLSRNLGGFVEAIVPTAFRRVLSSGAEVQAWFNHHPDSLLGSTRSDTLRLHEDSQGLQYDIAIDDLDPDHRRVVRKIERGDLRGSSFGFRVAPSGVEWTTTEQDYPLRRITEVAELRDVGPVSIPAYPDTQVALRSLAEFTGKPFDELSAAAGRNELRAYLLDPQTQPEPKPEPDEWTVMARARLAELEKSAPAIRRPKIKRGYIVNGGQPRVL